MKGMNHRLSGYCIICIFLGLLSCIFPVYAAGMSDEQIASEITDFFSGDDTSSLSSDELRTIGILFLMAADLKNAVENGSYDQIPVALNPETYTCVGADSETDYISQFFIFMGLVESNEKSFAGINLGDLMVALGMAEKSTATPKPTPETAIDTSDDPFPEDLDPDAMIKKGLNIPTDPERYSQYLSSPIALAEPTRSAYSGGMKPGIWF